jgi:hypothetical protein
MRAWRQRGCVFAGVRVDVSDFPYPSRGIPGPSCLRYSGVSTFLDLEAWRNVPRTLGASVTRWINAADWLALDLRVDVLV